MADKPQWQLLEWYRGCPIEHRPGMQRRGYLSIYHNHYRADGRIGTFVHHSLAAAHAHIDKLHKDLGDRVQLTERQYANYAAPTPGRPPGTPNPNGGAKPKGAARRVEITVTLDPELLARVTDYAKSNRISVSECINRLVADGIRRTQ